MVSMSRSDKCAAGSCESPCRLVYGTLGKVYVGRAGVHVGISVVVELRRGRIGMRGLDPPVELREGKYRTTEPRSWLNRGTLNQ